MEIRQVNDDYRVRPDRGRDVRPIKEAGYRASSATVRTTSSRASPQPQRRSRWRPEAADLDIPHIPFVSGQMTDEDVHRWPRHSTRLPGPVFAYCRSGARSTNIYLAARRKTGVAERWFKRAARSSSFSVSSTIAVFTCCTDVVRQQHPVDEFRQRFQIGRHDFQDVIHLAGQRVRLLHLRQARISSAKRRALSRLWVASVTVTTLTSEKPSRSRSSTAR